MSPSLLTLQPELHLAIISALGPDCTGLRDNDILEKYDEKGQFAVDRDTKLRKRRRESQLNLLNWSCTSKYFRSLLTPYIFKELTLRNDERLVASIEAIIAHPEYVKCVKTVHFIGYAPGDAKREDPAFKDTENILPRKVKEILGDLSRFPNLETLSVEFNYDFEKIDEWEEEGVNTADEAEADEDVGRKEQEEAWRALMARVWGAVSENKGGVVKKLELNRLYYKKVSTFRTPAFHKFLNSLEAFSISIFGGDNGAGWKSNTCEVWSDFVARLDTFFFDHLAQITSFTLKATEEGPIGLDGMNHVPFVLRKEHMPKLKNLHLEYMFLSPELRDFLVGKANTLEELHLRSCLAEIDDGMAEEGLHWNELFDAISSAKPTKLRVLKISEERPAPLPEDLTDCGKYDSKLEEEGEEVVKAQIEDARRTVKSGERKVWAHVCVDDKYGMLFEDMEENFLSFRERRDQEAYERLMDIVGKNNGGTKEL